jgi:hypothetical protein
MDTTIYIACPRQVVAFAPKVIKMRRLEYRILYRVKDSRRRTREGVEVWADGWAERGQGGGISFEFARVGEREDKGGV